MAAAIIAPKMIGLGRHRIPTKHTAALLGSIISFHRSEIPTTQVLGDQFSRSAPELPPLIPEGGGLTG
jgi:hypothetical protein